MCWCQGVEYTQSKDYLRQWQQHWQLRWQQGCHYNNFSSLPPVPALFPPRMCSIFQGIACCYSTSTCLVLSPVTLPAFSLFSLFYIFHPCPSYPSYPLFTPR